MLVHDGWFGADGTTLWSAVIERLADEFHLLVPDMLGFGGTDKVVFFDRSMYAYRSAHLGSFVRAVCGPENRVHVVGTSRGGSILLRDAVAADPQIPAASVMSISGSGGPWRSAFGAEQLGDYSGGAGDIARVMAHMADDFDGYEGVVAQRHQNTRIPGHVESLLAAGVKHPAGAKKPAPSDWPAPLEHLALPVTIVAGARDPLLEPGWHEHFASVSSLLTTRVIDSKHAPSLDHPDLVSTLIRETVTRASELVTSSKEQG
jgi:pimeloyl-ACP methyl ester carboxylesterase